ncbi:MAG: 4'-phosphopantetheinyl transferase superfamily protein [Salinisphaera sp.]|nr:4'-phosphopantetheinyl transferase superfamily protein [Salinisphaera sp.]
MRLPLPILGYACMEAIGDPDPGWIERLSADYRARLDAMASETARRQTLAGLRLLAEAGRSAGCAIPLGHLRRSAGGQPLLRGAPAFSISHSGAFCVCLLADQAPVGVDVERVRALRNRRVLRLLAPAEQAHAMRDPDAFFRYWTAREATVKATGEAGPRRLSQVRLTDEIAHIDGQRFHLQRPRLAPGYALCVASGAPLAGLIRYDFTASVRKNSAA